MQDFSNSVKLFMIFDILGDTERSGPLLWHIDRKRLEDIKNHEMDLLLMFRILRDKLPKTLDDKKIYDYIICHDLPEAITGDITKFEGITDDEIKRVTKIAISYLSDNFNDIIDFNTIINGYEEKIDLESKVVYFLDKLHSATTFIKYQSEKNVDMDDPRIIPVLRNHPFVVKKIAEGKDLADIFFEFHMMSIKFSEEELAKYHITPEEANNIVNIIRGFANEFYNQKLNHTLLNAKNNFPKDAMVYNRNK